MKKIILLLLCILFSFHLYCQESKQSYPCKIPLACQAGLFYRLTAGFN